MTSRRSVQYFRAPRTGAYERRYSSVYKLCLAVFLLVVLEGAFRKWIDDGLTVPLIAARDILCVATIALALRRGAFRANRNILYLATGWSALVIVWALLQVICGVSELPVTLVGLRFWLLYSWFGASLAVCFDRNDVDGIGAVAVGALLLMLPLVLAQHFLPPSAFLNRQVDGDELSVFRVTADIVRTTGTFSFTAGYTAFLVLASPFVLARSDRLSLSRLGVTACLGAATVVSGSRAAIIFFGAYLLVFVFLSARAALQAGKLSRVLILIACIAPIFVLPFLFDRAVEATQERFEAASTSEDFLQRSLTIFSGEEHVRSRMSFLGEGIGQGTNFAGRRAGIDEFLLAETETGRVLLEAGFLGVIAIVLKLSIVIWGLRRSWDVGRRTGELLPILLWMSTTVALLTWSIVGQLTLNALGCILAGLAVASVRGAVRQQ